MSSTEGQAAAEVLAAEFPVKVRLLESKSAHSMSMAARILRYHSSWEFLPLSEKQFLRKAVILEFDVTEDAALRLIDLEAVELI